MCRMSVPYVTRRHLDGDKYSPKLNCKTAESPVRKYVVTSIYRLAKYLIT